MDEFDTVIHDSFREFGVGYVRTQAAAMAEVLSFVDGL